MSGPSKLGLASSLRGTRALLDRERELAELDAIVAEAATGHGRLVLMEGPAGIGKSGLLTGLRERAGGRLRVLAA